MIVSTMQKLAMALLNEGYVVKKIEDEQIHTFNFKDNGEQYTGHIVIVVRPVEDEEAEAEAARLRKVKEKEYAMGVNSNNKSKEGVGF